MRFENVLSGIVKYLNAEVLVGMNDWQEMIARIAVSRVLSDPHKLKLLLMNNVFIKTFAIIDEEGNVDVDTLARDIRSYISQKGKMTISLPMFGNFTFVAEDVDKLCNSIRGCEQ